MVDNPINQDTAVAAYYKEDNNSLSTMGFSATRTIVQDTPLQQPSATQRTLGNLEGTVISTAPSTSSTKKTPSTQHTLSTFWPPALKL